MATIGEELRRERSRRGLTYKDVEQVLHIRSAYLEALEDGNFSLIPGAVYAKGFIRNYGNFLGLDGDRLVRQYRTLGLAEDTTLPMVLVTDVDANKEESNEYAAHGLGTSLAERRRGLRRWNPENSSVFIGIFLVCVAAFLIWLLWL